MQPELINLWNEPAGGNMFHTCVFKMDGMDGIDFLLDKLYSFPNL